MTEILSGRIRKADIDCLRSLILGSEDNAGKERLLACIFDSDRRVADNATWILASLTKPESEWLLPHRNRLIDLLLTSPSQTQRRLLITLLLHLPSASGNLRADLLNYCLDGMTSAREPDAIRAKCVHLAFSMCRHNPDLLRELRTYADMTLETPATPSLRSACRMVLVRIDTLQRRKNFGNNLQVS